MTAMPARRAASGLASVLVSPASRRIPGVRLFDPSENLHDGRLAGAVLADEGMNLAGLQAEGNGLQCPHAGIALLDINKFENRAGLPQDHRVTRVSG